MKNPLKNNKTFDLLKYKDYTAFWKRDGNNASGHPRYNVFIFNKHGQPAGYKNMTSYNIEDDIRFLINEYVKFLKNK